MMGEDDGWAGVGVLMRKSRTRRREKIFRKRIQSAHVEENENVRPRIKAGRHKTEALGHILQSSLSPHFATAHCVCDDANRGISLIKNISRSDSMTTWSAVIASIRNRTFFLFFSFFVQHLFFLLFSFDSLRVLRFYRFTLLLSR